MLAASSRSISAVGNGTRITSTLAMMPIGKIRSGSRANGDRALVAVTEAIRLSGQCSNVTDESSR